MSSAPVPSQRRRLFDLRSAWVWGVPLLAYLSVGIPLAIINQDRLNTDGVSYIRRAMYIAQGDFANSVSGYWSPLISWTMAPMIAIGVEGPLAAHLALLVWGAIFVVVLHLFLRTITDWGRTLRCLVLLAIVPVVLKSIVLVITPDLLLAACLFAYFTVLCHPRFLHDRRWQLLTGALGGVAYLAKSYALPFLLLHLPASVIVRWLGERHRAKTTGDERPAFAQAVSAFVIAGLGVALVAGPWIGILSVKYGRLTTSTSGPAAHSLLRPFWMADPARARENELLHLSLPPDPFIAHHENPDRSVWINWSPFARWSLFKHQVRIVRDHVFKARDIMGDFSVTGRSFNIGLIILAVATLAVFGFPRLSGVERWKLVWALGTIAAYCSGFLLVWFIPRYIELIVVPLMIVLALWILRGVDRTADDSGNDADDSETMVAALVRYGLLLGVFAWPAVGETFYYLTHSPLPAYRDTADEMRKLGLRGPIATNETRAGMYVGLYLDAKSVSIPRPTPEDPEYQAEKERVLLEKTRPGAIMVWSKPDHDEFGNAVGVSGVASPGEEEEILLTTDNYARELAGRLGWVRQFRIRQRGHMVEVFTKPAEATTTQPSEATAP